MIFNTLTTAVTTKNSVNKRQSSKGRYINEKYQNEI